MPGIFADTPELGLLAAHYYSAPGTVVSNVDATDGDLHAHPIFIPEPALFDRIGVVTSQAGGAGSIARCAIYTTQDGYPDRLLVDGGNLDVTTAAGLKVATIAAALDRGWYWLVTLITAPHATKPRFEALTSGHGYLGIPAPATASTIPGFKKTSVTSLPAKFGGTPTLVNAARVFLRKA